MLFRSVLSEVEELCDRVAVVVSGRVVYEGTMADLLKDSAGVRRSLEAALRPLYEKEVAA